MADEVEQVEATRVEANAGTIEQIERATIDLQIATAHKYPKHTGEKAMALVKKEILSLATLDEQTAADCFYVLPRAGKSIEGPSIRLAEIAISCYGNVRDSVRTIAVVPRGSEPHVVVQAVCHDLERNVAVSIEKRRRITKKKKKQFPDEDDINLAVNNAASIGLRDAAFRVIPRAFINPIVAACKKIAIGDARSIAAKRDTVIERLNKMGATIDRILAVLEVESLEDIGAAHVEVMIGLGTALKDGQCTLEEAFPKVEADADGKSTADRIKDKIKGDSGASTSPSSEPTEPSASTSPSSDPAPRKRKSRSDKGKSRKKTTPEAPPEDAEPERPTTDPSPQPEAAPKPAPKPETEPEEELPQMKWQCQRCNRQLSQLKNDKCPYCMGNPEELQ
jgi:hypothetical protein